MFLLPSHLLREIKKSVSHLDFLMSLLLLLLLFNISFHSFIVFPRNRKKTSRSIDYIGGLKNVIACPINKRRFDDLFFILFFLSRWAPLTNYFLIQPPIQSDKHIYWKIVTIEQLRLQTFFSSVYVYDRIREKEKILFFFFGMRIIIMLVWLNR